MPHSFAGNSITVMKTIEIKSPIKDNGGAFCPWDLRYDIYASLIYF